MALNADLLKVLACPICKKPVREDEERKELICDACSLAYEIRDGIPIMLPDSGRPLEKAGDTP